MKNLKYFLMGICIIYGTFFLLSCGKDEIVTKVDNITSERTREIPEGTNLPSLRNMPTVVSGILKFDSKKHLREFWEDIENTDDDQLELMEQTLGFISLRSLYYDVENSGNTLNGSFPFVINNPFDAMVFNQHHELWVGNEIYKLADKRLVVRTKSTYVSEILSMRNNEGVVRENTELIDRNTKEILPEPPVSIRTKCTMSITVPFNPTATNGGNSVYGYIRPIVINTNGDKVNICGGSISINWGDGFTTNANGDINAARNHVYNVGPGECKTFKVKVTVNLALCGECTGTILTEQIVTICSPIGCTSFEDERDETLVLSSGYGITPPHPVTFFMGYDTDDYLWHDARAWGRIKHFTVLPGGTGFSKPGFALRIRLHGAAFAETCTGSRIDMGKISRERVKNLCVMKKIDDINIRFRSDDDMFADFEVFGTSNTVPDVTLYNRPFSNL